jgi:predicted anti-sigma-YlaC factor YlaD
MPKHVTEWLGAYHDGELNSARLRQVEEHLAECAECQAELDAIQGLSALLRETAPAGEFIPTERFVANLTLNLPRQPEQPQPRKMLEVGWWLIPISLLGTWVFIQITTSLSSAFTAAVDAGLFGSNLSWLQGNPPQMEWFATTMNLFGNQVGVTGRIVLSELNEVNLFATKLMGNLLLQAVLAVLYLGWLAAWWLRHQHQSSPNPGNLQINKSI